MRSDLGRRKTFECLECFSFVTIWRTLMSGIWTITKRPSLTIHTFTAPEDGWLVTSHVAELSSQLLIIDAQYTLPYAREVAGYAASLNKPLSRLYVTHYHPDHLLGAGV